MSAQPDGAGSFFSMPEGRNGGSVGVRELRIKTILWRARCVHESGRVQHAIQGAAIEAEELHVAACNMQPPAGIVNGKGAQVKSAHLHGPIERRPLRLAGFKVRKDLL